MSNIYIIEPPTEGKVLLKTTVGDIDVELWSKETPKACRNFIQLCLENYYNNTIFHRVVKGFIVQGGDPTGTGEGGDSIYGEPFKDEFHSRLRFARRGLLAMANAGKDDNGSQFFFTMAATPELQNKHTIFGKVTGETVFNMLKLEEGLVDHDDRPLYPHKIIKTEVLLNPFPDIVPRCIPKKRTEEKGKQKEKKTGVKNFKLLSFGEEAEEDEEETAEANRQFSGRSKSTHDVLKDPKLSSVSAVESTSVEKRELSESEEQESDLSGDENTASTSKPTSSGLDNIRKKLKKDDSSRKDKNEEELKEDSEEEEYYFGKDREEEKKKQAEKLRKEIRDLKRDMRDDKQRKEDSKKKEEEEEKRVEMESKTLREYREQQEKYKVLKSQIPKKGSSREDFTLSLLNKFKTKLAAMKEPEEASEMSVNASEEATTAAAVEDDDDDVNDESWLKHRLQFESNAPTLAKDASTKSDDWFEIYDPRNPINKRRREDSKMKTKK